MTHLANGAPPKGGRDPSDFWFDFWAKVKEKAGCWLWTGRLVNPSGRGYELLGKAKLQMDAAELAWGYDGRELPKGKRLAFTCGNSRCIRPSHQKVANP